MDTARDLRLARKKRYRDAHPDKIRAARLAYKDRAAELNRASHDRRMAPIREARAVEQEARREQAARHKAERAAMREADRLAAPARRIAYDRAKAARRRAIARGAPCGRVHPDDLVMLRALQGNRCAYCGSDETLTLDHIVPVTRGGSHDLSNFQFLCLFHNISKGNHDDDAYRAWHDIPRLTPWDKASGLIRYVASDTFGAPAPDYIEKHSGGPPRDFVAPGSFYLDRYRDERPAKPGTLQPMPERPSRILKPMSESLARFLRA